MINLLPPERAASIRYARQNTILRKWLIGMAIAIIGLILILSGGWFYINQQSKNLQTSISLTDQQLKAQNLSQVQKDAQEITGDINVINKVLSQEIRFSDLIQAIGRDMPPGTILNSLSLSKVSGALDLTASSTDSLTAAQIAANLSDPNNGLFSKVDVINVTCGGATLKTSIYSCSVSLRALFDPSVKTKFLSVPLEDHS